MDDSRCMVESLKRLSYFYMHESCGQCTPCREGTGWLWRLVDRIHRGDGRPADMDVLDSVASNIMGRTICALGMQQPCLYEPCSSTTGRNSPQ